MKLFGRKRKKEQKNIDEILQQVTDEMVSPADMADEKKVQRYVLEHCQRLVKTAKELEAQKAEYRVVISSLKDIQIIEELPEREGSVLRDTAVNIVTLGQSQKEYHQTTKKITESQYNQMQRDEKLITSAIKNLQENEKYQSAVKRDMQYLESEKTEWTYYRQELESEQKLLRRLAYVLFGVLLMLMAVVLVLQMGFDMDAKLVFMFLILAGGAGGAFLFIRMQNNTAEMKKAEVNMNHAITLLNKVKIKYVHSTNAVDYVCEKYHVRNSYELNYLWEQYMESARQREKYERTSDDLEYFTAKLVRTLRKYNLYDAKIWLDQVRALIDKPKMAEIKQELNDRRQKMRSRIEYDMDVVLEQKEEIEKLMKQIGQEIPEVREILDSIDRLCGV